jgi:hypothetical protein
MMNYFPKLPSYLGIHPCFETLFVVKLLYMQVALYKGFLDGILAILSVSR